MASLSLAFDILARDKASAEFNKVADAADKTGKKVGKFGDLAKAGMAVAATAVVAFGANAIRSTSDLNETISKSRVIFGAQASGIEEWAKTSAKSFGLSRAAALDAAAGFGNMFQQLGFTGQAAADNSKNIVKMAADLGSFNNVDPTEVLEKIGGALRGEFDSLQQLIPNINAARVEQEALAATGKTLASELTAAEKATATLAIIQKDGAASAGDFARTSDGLANKQRILRAQFDDVSATVGTKLLPVVVDLLARFASLAEFTQRNQAVILPLVTVLGTFAGIIFTVSKGVQLYTAAQAALNVVMAANPIGLVVITVAALAAGMVVAYKKSETFRDVVNGAFRKVLGGVSALLGGIQGLFSALGNVPGFGWAKTAAQNIGGARAAVDGLKASLDRLPASKTVTVNYQQVGSITSVPYKARALGGPVSAGQPYLVGERGPELILPQRSGYVLPARQTAAALSGGSSGDNIVNVYVSGSVVGIDDLVGAVSSGIGRSSAAFGRF